MKRSTLALLTGILFLNTALWAQEKQTAPKKGVHLNFENIAVGKLPVNWKVEATNKRGPLATWQVIADSTAPSGKKILALTGFNQTFGGTFNLCWSDKVQFLNGIIAVQFKANSGLEDEGGGVIWRAQDKDNYYIARFNPLEDNFRIYYVKDGARRMLASARLKLAAHQWHSMKIVQNGNKISGFLNGKKYLEVENKTFSKAGGVGLWTKADAATSFDDFSVQMLKK